MRQDRRHEQEAGIFLHKKKNGYDCFQAAGSYQNDPEKMLYFYDKSCEYGYSDGCLEAIKFVQEDNNRAMTYAYKACELNDLATCRQIKEIAKNACDEGDQDGCKWLDIIKNRK